MKPSDEEALLAGLRTLRDNSAEIGPPASLEAVLLTEFRHRRKARRKPFLWIGLAAAAALVLVAAAVASRQPIPEARVQVTGPVVQPALVQPALVQPAVVHPAVVHPPPAHAASRKANRRVPRPQREPAPLAQEVATEFLAMPYAPSFTAEDRGLLVRVRLPRESMHSFGLPVNQDRIIQSVKADVLIGEDGIARAIRFVQ